MVMNVYNKKLISQRVHAAKAHQIRTPTVPR